MAIIHIECREKRMSDKEKILALLNLGYTYRMLSKICDVHHTTLSNWCAGVTDLTPRLLERIHNNLLTYKDKLDHILE